VGRSAVRQLKWRADPDSQSRFAIEVRNRTPDKWPRESVEDGNDQPDGDQTLGLSSLGSRRSGFHTVLRYEGIQRT
jgi:hypothetical protein